MEKWLGRWVDPSAEIFTGEAEIQNFPFEPYPFSVLLRLHYGFSVHSGAPQPQTPPRVSNCQGTYIPKFLPLMYKNQILMFFRWKMTSDYIIIEVRRNWAVGIYMGKGGGGLSKLQVFIAYKYLTLVMNLTLLGIFRLFTSCLRRSQVYFFGIFTNFF